VSNILHQKVLVPVILTCSFLIAENPKQYLIEHLEQLNAAKTAKVDYPCLFDDSNIRSVFGMLDPTGRGCITLRQYREGKTFVVIPSLSIRPAEILK
jgi:hypothetical protein